VFILADAHMFVKRDCTV